MYKTMTTYFHLMVCKQYIQLMLHSFETIMTMALELVFIHLECSLILLCNENRSDHTSRFRYERV
ncbi:hypothetical protein HanRHA438_Chr01g0020051 [Helianthus annuus]|uniref:Uncharacterized protein n=1 Tax=Helianthus annuus TaxID=4232 RepID=A0A251VMU6_HELAN|nr:hypothetical protein HanXRQr2_Chr01g0019481 [Helianthus annuus]KAJ0611446.1 hypothetical protein HanHA300_Chr01g0015881 [Helianthus annuus]KAJ0622495.1 hypothetical protein HanIR_Chr01g0021321 [Helianthus annuus]KAJ0626745.1 hypothetical protein HanHA89_Chr01g0017501 [Helianthus annuus]KAJ0783092.1 hypothetical protein HanLR1_Chr01g0016431 [Helianthus annuus]